MASDEVVNMPESEVKVDLLKIALAIQLAFLGTFLSNQLGFEIPILRQFVGSLYLFLVPGTLLALILKLNKAEFSDFLLYSIGLSLSSIMILGLILNFIGPHVGINRPVSPLPLFITLTTFFVILYTFCLFRRKEEAILTLHLTKNLIPAAIAFSLLLLLAILGDYLVYYEDNNILLLILLVAIALIAFSPLSKRLQPLYPLIIFLTSLSLIYHIVLSSPYSFGGDAHYEYGFSYLVTSKGIWDPSAIASNSNAMLSLSILVPSFCHLCNMNVIQVFKIIFPIILSLVPLGLYLILRKQISPEVAFFSSYFYISIRPFYTWVSEFIKQGTAMFFLMLIILVLTSKRGEGRIANEILLLLFSFSLITSHYGTSYVFMLSLIVVYVFLLYRDKKLAGSLTTYLSLYIVLAISWYMHVSQGSAFETILNIGNHIISNIQYLFNPEAVEGLRMLTYTIPFLSYKILKILHLFTDFFIVFGFISIAYHKLREIEEVFSEEFFSFSIPSLGFILLSTVLPYFTGMGFSMGFQRIYSIVLFFLAPFCIIGVTRFIQGIEKRFSISFGKLDLRFLAVFFAIFLLFNSGWVTEVTKEYIGSVAISQARIKCYGTAKEKASLYCRYFAEEDVFSARWLSDYVANTKIISDFYAIKVLQVHSPEKFLGAPYWGRKIITRNTIEELDEDTYVYLRKLNWEDGIMTKFVDEKDWVWDTQDIVPTLNSMNKIYSNGGSVIFYR